MVGGSLVYEVGDCFVFNVQLNELVAPEKPVVVR